MYRQVFEDPFPVSPPHKMVRVRLRVRVSVSVSVRIGIGLGLGLGLKGSHCTAKCLVVGIIFELQMKLVYS
jgi:hypothetical protein